MKQKIVIKVRMSSEKCRIKAMRIAAKADGVNSVGVQGSDKDQLVVSGEGVDSVNLTRSLRKKLCHTTTILSVEEVKEKGKEPEKVEKNPEVPSYIYIPQVPVFYQYQLPNPNYYEVVDDPYNCSIM